MHMWTGEGHKPQMASSTCTWGWGRGTNHRWPHQMGGRHTNLGRPHPHDTWHKLRVALLGTYLSRRGVQRTEAILQCHMYGPSNSKSYTFAAIKKNHHRKSNCLAYKLHFHKNGIGTNLQNNHLLAQLHTTPPTHSSSSNTS